MRSFKRLASLLFGFTLLVVMLLWSNSWFISRLLHIDRNLIGAAKRRLVPVGKPLVLKGEGDGACRLAEEWFSLLEVKRQPLPNKHRLLLDISWVQRVNPFPPLVAESMGGQGSYCSFGYLGVDGRYHQITQLWGEADTLPNFLVRKVRGDKTFWGDYFVDYLFVMSRERDLLEMNGRPYYPRIDAVEWGSFRGGSYNGFEEILGITFATLMELLLIGSVGVFVYVRRRGQPRGPLRV